MKHPRLPSRHISPDAVLALLADNESRHIDAIASAMKCKPDDVRPVLNALIRIGSITGKLTTICAGCGSRAVVMYRRTTRIEAKVKPAPEPVAKATPTCPKCGRIGYFISIRRDGSEQCRCSAYGKSKSSGGSGVASQKFTSKNGIYGKFADQQRANAGGLGDTGTAARFFYCAKASKVDRGEGNGHPTVKPQSLMAYLCRLITPPGGTVLDCFMGSGSTGKAAIAEGFGFVGIERDRDSFETAERRIAEAVERETFHLFAGATP